MPICFASVYCRCLFTIDSAMSSDEIAKRNLSDSDARYREAKRICSSDVGYRILFSENLAPSSKRKSSSFLGFLSGSGAS